MMNYRHQQYQSVATMHSATTTTTTTTTASSPPLAHQVPYTSSSFRTTTTTSNTVIWNNLGARYLEARDYKLAIEYLSKAFHSSRQDIARNKQDQSVPSAFYCADVNSAGTGTSASAAAAATSTASPAAIPSATATTTATATPPPPCTFHNGTHDQNDMMMMLLYSPTAIDVWMKQRRNTGPNDDGSATTMDDFGTHDRYLYQHPIYIPEQVAAAFDVTTHQHHQHHCHEQRQDFVVPAVAITFNLALAFFLSALEMGLQCHHNRHHQQHHHHQQQQQQQNAGHTLQQSLKLFQYAFRLQQTRADVNETPMFFMSSMNNIGIIYELLGLTDQAQICFQQLLSLLMLLTTTSSPSSTSSNMTMGYHQPPARHPSSSSTFEGFFQNTSRYSHMNYCHCAKAA